jgi:hypothetical protein
MKLLSVVHGQKSKQASKNVSRYITVYHPNCMTTTGTVKQPQIGAPTPAIAAFEWSNFLSQMSSIRTSLAHSPCVQALVEDLHYVSSVDGR